MYLCVTQPGRKPTVDMMNISGPRYDPWCMPQTPSRPVANISLNSLSCIMFLKKNHLCTTCCLLSMTWTLWTNSAMQRHLNYHRHEPRDLEHRLFHTVLLITNSSRVISCSSSSSWSSCHNFWALSLIS